MIPARVHSSTGQRPFRAAAQARSAAILEDVRTIVNIPSGPGSGDGLERVRAFFVERLVRLGAEITLVPGSPREHWLSGPAGESDKLPPPTVIARRAIEKAASHDDEVRIDPIVRGVLLCGHLDTVHAASSPFSALQIAPDGLTATGPGCVDMKSGLLIALHALEVLESCGIRVPWTFVLNSDEETGSYHSSVAMETEAARGYVAGLVFEPAMADGGLVVSRPGSGQFMIECSGKAGHVGRDFRSCISAVTRLGECIVQVATLADPDRGAIVNIGPLVGGEATNIVPDYAAAWGNVRFDSEEVGAELAAQLDSLASRPGELPGTRIARSFHRPAKPLTPGTEQLALLAQQCAQAIGQALPFGSTGGVCDGNNLQRAGLATIDTLGARGGGLHTTKEWIEVPSLVERMELTATLIASLLTAER